MSPIADRIEEFEHPLIQALLDPAVYDHEVTSFRVIETHISWVILTGSYVYKIKKPVRLPFLDFSTLQQRRFFCEEELRLNRRLVPDLYLGVVPIGGSVERPVIGGQPAIEYAVKIREFPADSRLDELLAAGAVHAGDICALAETIAGFHESLSSSQHYGNPLAITRAVLTNLKETEQIVRGSERREVLATLRDWISGECVRLERALAARKLRGHIRECHGDLHLENLAYWEGRIVPFDALEFDPGLRWIDVMDEVAFLCMDLIAHDRLGFAHEFLNRYLEVTGDYAGLEILRFYLIHRATVRSKVAAIKGSQAGRSGSGAEKQVDSYLRCARGLIQPASPLLLMTHGFSGSGKTTVTNGLISQLPAIRCRSDLERKRMHAVAPRASSGSRVGGGLYTRGASEATYAALRRYATRALKAGLNVIVDATFLRRAERKSFIQLAATEKSGVAIIDCRAPERVLRERIQARTMANIDASEATVEVLDHQLGTNEPFDPEEEGLVINVETDRELDLDVLVGKIRTFVRRSPGHGTSEL